MKHRNSSDVARPAVRLARRPGSSLPARHRSGQDPRLLLRRQPRELLSRHQHDRHVVRRQQPDLQPHRRLRARGTTSRARPREAGTSRPTARSHLLLPAQGRQVAQPPRAKPTRHERRRHHLHAERQGRDNPYFKVTSSNHSYFNDMGMGKLIKSVQKVDDRHGPHHAQQARGPFLSDLAMEYAGVQSKEYADAMPRPARRRRSTRSRSAPVRSTSCSTRRTRSSATRRSRSSGAARPRSTTSCSRSRRTPRCAGPSCRRASAT